MARNLNEATLIGRVGKDPEIKTTQSGKAFARFSVATSSQWRDQSGEQQERTEWHRITAWGKQVDFIEQYVHKGDLVFVRGDIRYSTVTGDDGIERYFTDINAMRVDLLSSKGEGRKQQQSKDTGSIMDPDDDLPF